MKYTIFITQECNLDCTYCYIKKRPLKMSMDIAKKVIDFIYNNTPKGDKIEIGFFGGEPILEFESIKKIVSMIENHSSYRYFPLEMSIVTNGTIFSAEIANFLNSHKIGFCLSCDGPAKVQNISRRFKNGGESSIIVEKTIRQAGKLIPSVLVNSVITPNSYKYLCDTINYFTSLGLSKIYINPDYLAPWTKEDAERIKDIYESIGNMYIDSYKKGKPLYISFIDSKIAVILRGGYQAEERCHMGKKEFAFTPEGNIFPCERLVGDGMKDNPHCIGHIDSPLDLRKVNCNILQVKTEISCISCGLRDYCMNWCGCSNFMSTGYYNRVGAFLCAEERATIQVALRVFQTLEEDLGPLFYEHLSGETMLNNIKGNEPFVY